jgi:hypothetical protein
MLGILFAAHYSCNNPCSRGGEDAAGVGGGAEGSGCAAENVAYLVLWQSAL